MQFTRKKTKWLGLAVGLAVAIGCLLIFGLNKPLSASAAVTSNAGAVYQGYTDIESGNGNWYSDNIAGGFVLWLKN